MLQHSLLDQQVNIATTRRAYPAGKAQSPPKMKPKDGGAVYKWEIVWLNVIAFTVLHCLALHGLYLLIVGLKIKLFVFTYLLAQVLAQGITAGAHRLWAHRAYKATLPLRIILLILQTASFQNSVYVWVRDHRLHHKYTDSDADPHNATRGFFFSHMGWLFLKKLDAVKTKGRSIDMSDIKSDPLLMFQHRVYYPLMAVLAFVLPTYLSMRCCGEDAWTSFCVTGAFRYITSVHLTWLVNSAAHMYGTKPYDTSIGPAENKLVAHFACGEGFHNYHHVFPWDYKTAELGGYSLNITLFVINCFAKIGWAYDLRSVSEETIKRRVVRTGNAKLLLR